MSNDIFYSLDDIIITIKDKIFNLPDSNLLTDTLENKILNQENIITNKVLEIRPDSEYKNSNVNKEFIGLDNVVNFEQVKLTDKATILQATGGTDDDKWMTPLKTKEAILQFDSESGSESVTTEEVTKDIWLYGGV